MYNIAEISERIHAMRDLCGYTTEEMAEATDVTVEEYIKCETGQKDFSFTFLYKCADKFGIDMVELITGENPHLTDFTIVHDGKGLPIKRRAGFDYFHLASNFKGKISEPFLVSAPYKEEEQDAEIHTSVHEGQEFDYILTGSLKFKYNGHEENLIAGDSVYYDSGKPHGMIATSKDGCTFLAIVMKEGSKK
ncbi:MAG: cupin domain-containing protein [Candidatus Methanomethylophilaceae archaeon]|nr:cupin domain-containing protein [Candidatus Methanomethylophilaceae archaeon]